MGLRSRSLRRNMKAKRSDLYCLKCGRRGLLILEGDDYYDRATSECPECKNNHSGFDYDGVDSKPFEYKSRYESNYEDD